MSGCPTYRLILTLQPPGKAVHVKFGAVPHQRTTTLWAEKVASRAPQSRVCHADASTVTPQLASQAALERRPDLLRTHMPEWSR